MVFNYLLFLGMGVVAFFLFKKAFNSEKKKQLPPTNLANLTVKDAREGDVISIAGAGDDFDDLEFDVDRRNRYESGGESWYELSGIYKGRRVYLEWRDDDEVEVFLSKGKEVYLDELGISEQDLVRFDQEESRSNHVMHDGQKWRYESSKEIGYFKHARGEGEGFYAWEFLSEDKNHAITVEKWEGEPFEASVSERVTPSNVTVLRK